ncbi:C-type mannose receptor 2 [Patella vulgata]|uniref:C-type mannose receptor 2 n=1 Tax=Patella vulgata TaxID=6465 RepID=UPI00218001B4|nr:C-type mannose receptor 2 [Patella vulgata]
MTWALTLCILGGALVSLTSGSTQEELYRCPVNIQRGQYLHTHGDKCYEFVTTRKNHWQEARAYCQNNGGDLLTVKDDVVEEFIVGVLRSLNFYSGVWIGLTDVQKEGEYRWVTGEVSSYYNWSPGEPSLFLHNFEDCVVLKMDAGRWLDAPCELPLDSYPWVCEYALQPATTTTTKAIPTTIKMATHSTVKKLTQATTTSKPTTVKKVTHAPTTPKPTTVKMATHAPTTPKPTTVKNVTHAPTTPKPTTVKMATHAPTTPKPTTVKKVTHAPTTPKPTTVKMATHAPTTPKPTTVKMTVTGKPGKDIIG